MKIEGALFDSDPVHEIAFRYSIENVNSMRNVLPRSILTSTPERIPRWESFIASKKGIISYLMLYVVCQMNKVKPSSYIERKKNQSLALWMEINTTIRKASKLIKNSWKVVSWHCALNSYQW